MYGIPLPLGRPPIRDSLPLVDGGYLNRPEFSRYDLEGKTWIMEGHSVDPDIVVDNDPAHEYAGIDDQFNKAIEIPPSKGAAHAVSGMQPLTACAARTS